jgi:hypothetical protein
VSHEESAALKPRVLGLNVGGDSAAWDGAGFAVDSGAVVVGTVRLRLAGGKGVDGWRLGNVTALELDGLATELADPGESSQPGEHQHPNGVSQIDHIVVFTPDLERTTAAFEAAGVERRRVREAEVNGSPLRQGFFRLSEVILEVVEHENARSGPAAFWGITFTTGDLDGAATLLGERLGSIRDAVQPGRRIATFRKEAGLTLPVALITPEIRPG